MKKAYINELQDNKRMVLSEYKAVITNDDESEKENKFVQYSYSYAFEIIKAHHEKDDNSSAKSILLEVIK